MGRGARVGEGSRRRAGRWTKYKRLLTCSSCAANAAKVPNSSFTPLASPSMMRVWYIVDLSATGQRREAVQVGLSQLLTAHSHATASRRHCSMLQARPLTTLGKGDQRAHVGDLVKCDGVAALQVGQHCRGERGAQCPLVRRCLQAQRFNALELFQPLPQQAAPELDTKEMSIWLRISLMTENQLGPR